MSFRGEQRSFLNLLFEVVLIAVGVFLALWANNWHENSEHRAQAWSALRNFATEMEANRQATQRNRSYHKTLARESFVIGAVALRGLAVGFHFGGEIAQGGPGLRAMLAVLVPVVCPQGKKDAYGNQ